MARTRPPLLPSVALLLWLLAPTSGQVLAAGDGPQAGDTQANIYRLWYRNYDSPAVLAALRLAFDKTPEYGPYVIRRSPEMVQGRALLELQEPDHRVVTIVNVATSPQREESLNAIPLPIDGGLLGLRVCVIKAGHQARFDGITSLQDFVDRGLSIGQGTHWPDRDVLAANGIPVVTHTRFETLFVMLRRERFDCFARGVSEVFFDLQRVEDQGLVIEDHLMLAYPMPSYFFVGPDDHDTAQRIQLGLERAIADGSFALHLATYYGRAMEALKLRRRQLLILDNPDLSADSIPVGRQALETLERRILNGLSR